MDNPSRGVKIRPMSAIIRLEKPYTLHPGAYLEPVDDFLFVPGKARCQSGPSSRSLGSVGRLRLRIASRSRAADGMGSGFSWSLRWRTGTSEAGRVGPWNTKTGGSDYHM